MVMVVVAREWTVFKFGPAEGVLYLMFRLRGRQVNHLHFGSDTLLVKTGVKVSTMSAPNPCHLSTTCHRTERLLLTAGQSWQLRDV